MRPQHWCFPVKFATFLRTAILESIYERLLLQILGAKNEIDLVPDINVLGLPLYHLF